MKTRSEATTDERPLDRLVRRLPAPRLQLRWARNPDASCRFGWLCHYELVLPLGEHDIRREVYDDDGELSGKVEELVVAMKEPTRRDADCVPCTAMRGERYADSPYRDGAHAKWDATALGNLPVFVIAPDGEAFVEQPND